LKAKGTTVIERPVKMIELLKRTEISYDDFAYVDLERPKLSKQEIEQIDIQIKYAGYIKLQLEQVQKFKKLETKILPSEIEYSGIKGLSLESRQKLGEIKPTTVGQASRISGVSPADIAVLLIFLKQNEM